MARYAVDEAFLQNIERLQSVLKNNLAGMFGGNHKAKTFGSSCEFSDYRDYIPGDDITKIDWNVYARTETLALKLYLDERRLHTKIYIDVSQSMEYGGGERAEKALQIAATVAYLSIVELDKVSIYTIRNSEVTCVIADMAGRESFFREITKLNGIEFGGEAMISDGILPEKVGYGDGLSVIISDFLTDSDYESAIDYLVDKKRDLLCVQLLTKEELDPDVHGKNHFFDSENREKYYRKNINREVILAYRKAVKYVEERLRSYCSARGASYLLVPAQKAVDEIFFGDLAQIEVVK